MSDGECRVCRPWWLAWQPSNDMIKASLVAEVQQTGRVISSRPPCDSCVYSFSCYRNISSSSSSSSSSLSPSTTMRFSVDFWSLGVAIDDYFGAASRGDSATRHQIWAPFTQSILTFVDASVCQPLCLIACMSVGVSSACTSQRSVAVVDAVATTQRRIAGEGRSGLKMPRCCSCGRHKCHDCVWSAQHSTDAAAAPALSRLCASICLRLGGSSLWLSDTSLTCVLRVTG